MKTSEANTAWRAHTLIAEEALLDHYYDKARAHATLAQVYAIIYAAGMGALA